MRISFNPFPVISTKNFVLRQLSSNDAAGIFLLRSDDSVNRFLDRPRALKIDEAEAFIIKTNKSIEKNESIYWVITSKKEDTLLATICLWNIDKENGIAEIGYEVLPAKQGKGLMQEVIPAIIDYGFNTLQLSVIRAELSPDNLKSVSLLLTNKFSRSMHEENHRNSATHTVIYSRSNNE